MKILIIGPSWIGDMMMSQSLYRTLKKLYPQALIDVTAPTWCCSLLSFMPEVNKAILMPFEHGILKIGARLKLGYSLRERQYDRAYVLPNSFKSTLVPFFAGIPYRIGWQGEIRYGLLNDIRIMNTTAWPLMVERYVALAYNKDLVRSAKDLPQPLLWPQIQISEITKLNACKKFRISFNRSIIGFCLGAESNLAKRWPYYHYAELAMQLICKGYQVILFGSLKDQEAGNKILALLSKKQQVWCRNLAGKTHLKQVVVLISSCKAVVTNDSGLMHITAALNRPLVALYGPSNPDFTPPLSHKARVIRLITSSHKRYKNPTKKYHRSLIDIKPQCVFNELSELLSNEENSDESTNC